MLDSLSHHAFLIVGLRENILPELLREVEKNGITIRGNPDVRQESFELMGIDEARMLKEAAERTAVAGGKKIFIVSAQGMTREAQNALLKILEEPATGTHFFFIVPRAEMLLTTLASRLFMVRVAPSLQAEDRSATAASFLAAENPARLKKVAELLKEAEKSEGKTGLHAFLDGLEATLAQTTSRERTTALEEFFRCKKYARDRAVSFKLLLEHLALVLPRL